MTGFTIRTPWPPTGNLNVRHTKTGQHYLTKQTLAFRKEVWYAVREKNIKALVGRLMMKVTAFPPDRRHRDLDNVIKPLCDSLQKAGAFKNDSAIDSLFVLRGDLDPNKKGCLLVTVETL